MNFSNCFGSLFAVGLVTAGLVTALAAPAYAPTRVGEAAVVKNEVLRVAGPSTTRIKVGDGLVRDETVRTAGPQPVGNTLHGGAGLRIAY